MRKASSQNKGSPFKRTCFPHPSLVFLVLWRQEMSLDIKVWQGSESLPLLCAELSTTPDTRWEHTHVCVHTAILFPSFRINPNHDITRWCNGRLGAAKHLKISQRTRRRAIGRFIRWESSHFVGEARPAVECKYLVCPWYIMKITVRQEYLCSYPGDRQPGSIHQDVNIVITHKPHGHKGKSVKKSYWLLLDNESWLKMNLCWHSSTVDDITNQGGHENVSPRFSGDVNICCSVITSGGFIWIGDTTAKSRVNNNASGK